MKATKEGQSRAGQIRALRELRYGKQPSVKAPRPQKPKEPPRRQSR